jgi:hypothetical protein
MPPPLQRLLNYSLFLCISILSSYLAYKHSQPSKIPMSTQPNSNEAVVSLLVDSGLNLQSIDIIQSLWAGYGKISRIYAIPEDTDLTPQKLQSYIVKLVKPPPTKTDDEGHARKILSYRVEQYFYTHLASQMPASIPVAKCLASVNEVHSDGTSTTAMLLSDLRNEYPIAGESHPLTSVQVNAALDWLANFHGFWWTRSEELHTSSLVLPPLQEIHRKREEEGRSVWLNGGYTYLSTRRSEYNTLTSSSAPLNTALTSPIDGTNISIAEVAAAFLAPSSSSSRYQTLIHGDVKSENLFTSVSGSEVAFYDFQYVGLGLGVCDLAKFFTVSVPLLSLPSSSSKELPIQPGEEALLRRYLIKLREVSGKEYDWALFLRHWETALVDWYRFQASWGFWGNTGWLEARVRSILKDDGWRADLLSEVDIAGMER